MGEGFVGEGSSIQRPSGDQWSQRQSFEGQPRQSGVGAGEGGEGGMEGFLARRVPVPPPQCPSDWEAMLSFSQGVGDVAM